MPVHYFGGLAWDARLNVFHGSSNKIKTFFSISQKYELEIKRKIQITFDEASWRLALARSTKSFLLAWTIFSCRLTCLQFILQTPSSSLSASSRCTKQSLGSAGFVPQFTRLRSNMSPWPQFLLNICRLYSDIFQDFVKVFFSAPLRIESQQISSFLPSRPPFFSHSKEV